jgi:hypothetical protein
MNNGSILESVMNYKPKNQYRYRAAEHEMVSSQNGLRN